jgi:hypothetical protein
VHSTIGWEVAPLAIVIGLSACSDRHVGATPISPREFPRIKAGLWRSTLREIHYPDAHKPKPVETFTDQACMPANGIEPAKPPQCSRMTLGRTLNGTFVADWECRMPEGPSRSRDMFQGDFDRHFTKSTWIRRLSSTGGDMALDNKVEDYVYLGPCPAKNPGG